MINFIIFALASFIHGIIEGYGFDSRKSFERKWGIKSDSFFGSLSHTNKTFLSSYIGVIDFYHVADDLRKYLFVFSLFGITSFTFFQWVLFFMVGIVSMQIGLSWIRKDTFVPHFITILLKTIKNGI